MKIALETEIIFKVSAHMGYLRHACLHSRSKIDTRPDLVPEWTLFSRILSFSVTQAANKRKHF